jgi:hypothetical protein
MARPNRKPSPQFRLIGFDDLTRGTEVEWEQYCRRNNVDMRSHGDDLSDEEIAFIRPALKA